MMDREIVVVFIQKSDKFDQWVLRNGEMKRRGLSRTAKKNELILMCPCTKKFRSACL